MMRGSVAGSQSALTIPPSQNTAPVLEFSCLYTHDLRRKQKRWQDGFLRYHTFNRRVMVYDIPRNFIGDTHCTQDQALQDGDEISLEKGGVLVQVSELIGQTNTDLTELLQKRDKSSAGHASSSPIRGAPTPRPSTNGPSQYSKHKSLNALLGTPRGPLGKATVAAKSPFEQRYKGKENDSWTEGRPSKRLKTADHWNVTRTTEPLHDRSVVHSPVPIAETPKRKVGTSGGVVKGRNALGQSQIKAKEIIELSSDTLIASDPVGSEEASLPWPRDATNTAVHSGRGTNEPVRSAASRVSAASLQSRMRTGSPNREETSQLQPKATSVTGKLPIVLDKSRPPSRITGLAFKRRVDPSVLEDRARSPPVKTSSQHFVETDALGLADSKLDTASADSNDSSARKGASLRLVGTAPRKMLMCRDQLTRKSSGKTSEHAGSIALADGPRREDANGQRLLRREKEAEQVRSRPATSRSEFSDDAESTTEPHKQRLLTRLAKFGMPKKRLFRASSSSPPPRHNDPYPESPLAFEPMELPSIRARSIAASWEVPSEATSVADTGEMEIEPKLDQARTSNSSTTHASMGPPAVDGRRRTVNAPFLHSAAREPTSGFASAKTTLDVHADSANRVREPSKYFKRTKGPPNKTVTLDLRTGGDPVSTTLLAKPFKKPASKAELAKDVDLGPWSKEACDLFEWRPPDRDVNGKKLDLKRAPAGLSGGVDGPITTS